MNFSRQKIYGRDCFYPEGKLAIDFVNAFPHSSGKRKSLTLTQISILKNLGADVIITEKPMQPIIFLKTEGEIENVSPTNNRL